MWREGDSEGPLRCDEEGAWPQAEAGAWTQAAAPIPEEEHALRRELEMQPPQALQVRGKHRRRLRHTLEKVLAEERSLRERRHQ
jgi:hypothetical protein